MHPYCGASMLAEVERHREGRRGGGGGEREKGGLVRVYDKRTGGKRRK